MNEDAKRLLGKIAPSMMPQEAPEPPKFTPEEDGINASTDPRIDQFPLEIIAETRGRIDGLLGIIFASPLTRQIELGPSRLDWQTYMPQVQLISDIPERSRPEIEIEKDRVTKGSSDFKFVLRFNCGNDEGDAELSFTYDRDTCIIQRTGENEFGETITEIEDGEAQAFQVAHRLSRFEEALRFVKMEREFRRTDTIPVDDIPSHGDGRASEHHPNELNP